MKTPLASFLLLGCFLWGCSGEPARIDTSGSHPSLGKPASMTPAAVEAEVDTGRLLVVAPESGYTVYGEDGRQVAHEPNRAGLREGLKLAPGRYFVRLDEPVRGPREFWVTVERIKVTRVDFQTGNGPAPEVR